MKLPQKVVYFELKIFLWKQVEFFLHVFKKNKEHVHGRFLRLHSAFVRVNIDWVWAANVRLVVDFVHIRNGLESVLCKW